MSLFFFLEGKCVEHSSSLNLSVAIIFLAVLILLTTESMPSMNTMILRITMEWLGLFGALSAYYNLTTFTINLRFPLEAYSLGINYSVTNKWNVAS